MTISNPSWLYQCFTYLMLQFGIFWWSFKNPNPVFQVLSISFSVYSIKNLIVQRIILKIQIKFFGGVGNIISSLELKLKWTFLIIFNLQEKEYKLFKEQQKQELKLLRQELDLDQKKDKKEVLKKRKDQKDIELQEKVTSRFQHVFRLCNKSYRYSHRRKKISRPHPTLLHS